VSEIMMSAGLADIIADEELNIVKKPTTDNTSQDIIELVVEMENSTVSGRFTHGEWSDTGELNKLIVRLDKHNTQKAFRGNKITSIGFLTDENEKASQAALGKFDSITYLIDSVEEDIYMTITIHQVQDT